VKTLATNKHFGLVVIARGAGNGLNGTQREATSDTASAPDPDPQNNRRSFFGFIYDYGTDLLTPN